MWSVYVPVALKLETFKSTAQVCLKNRRKKKKSMTGPGSLEPAAIRFMHRMATGSNLQPSHVRVGWLHVRGCP